MAIKRKEEMFGDGGGFGPAVPVDTSNPPGHSAGNRGIAFGEAVTAAGANRSSYALAVNDEDLEDRLLEFETSGLDAAYRLGAANVAGGGRVIDVDGGSVDVVTPYGVSDPNALRVRYTDSLGGTFDGAVVSALGARTVLSAVALTGTATSDHAFSYIATSPTDGELDFTGISGNAPAWDQVLPYGMWVLIGGVFYAVVGKTIGTDRLRVRTAEGYALPASFPTSGAGTLRVYAIQRQGDAPVSLAATANALSDFNSATTQASAQSTLAAGGEATDTALVLHSAGGSARNVIRAFAPQPGENSSTEVFRVSGNGSVRALTELRAPALVATNVTASDVNTDTLTAMATLTADILTAVDSIRITSPTGNLQYTSHTRTLWIPLNLADAYPLTADWAINTDTVDFTWITTAAGQILRFPLNSYLRDGMTVRRIEVMVTPANSPVLPLLIGFGHRSVTWSGTPPGLGSVTTPTVTSSVQPPTSSTTRMTAVLDYSSNLHIIEKQPTATTTRDYVLTVSSSFDATGDRIHAARIQVDVASLQAR